jgi:hypothetical protein
MGGRSRRRKKSSPTQTTSNESRLRPCIISSVGATDEQLNAWLERWSDLLVGQRRGGCRCCVVTVDFDQAPKEALEEAEELGILGSTSGP